MTSRFTRFKAVLVGRPLASYQADLQLLPKRLALPVFASDALSSVAYATEEAMIVLALAGVAAFSFITPVSLAVATLLGVVVVSYRQTIRAYPQGGGAFSVATDNFGIGAGAVAASSLLVDYVLTVAVSVSAGVAAITSAVPELIEWRVSIALFLIVMLTVANLRGVKEASTVFSVPTYLFILTVLAMLITGFARCLFDSCPTAVSAGLEIDPVVGSVTVFLILRAFASGASALTGVEAVANGVQAFREPKAHNAATTLALMGTVAISLFLGISTLARLTGVRITHETVNLYGTVLSQVGRAVFGGGLGFWLLQVFTALILILAANTAYQGFPLLSAILSDHRLLPRQFRNRGDRLVFSNGVVVLALLTGSLIVVFHAEVTRLIQLYVVGVFTSFTISQAGMIRHWLRSRAPGWRRSIVINAVGAVTTGVVGILIAFASGVTFLLSIDLIPQKLTAFVQSITRDPTAFILLVMLVLVPVGMFLESNAAYIMLVPLLHPIAVLYGVDPLHFAFLFVLNLVIGMLTPPVGVLLFVVSSARQIPVNTLVRNVYPFILVQFAVLALCIAFPPIVTWLPKQLGY